MARARKTAPKPDQDTPVEEIAAATAPDADAVVAKEIEEPVAETASPEIELPEPGEAIEAAPPVREEPPPPPREIVRVEKRGGFGPLLLGGLIAGGLGFASASYVLPRFLAERSPDDLPAEIGADLAGQTEKIAALQAEVENLKGQQAAPAAAVIPEELTTGIAQLGDRVQALEQATVGLSDRMTKIEARPLTGDPASAEALEAIRREIGDQLKAVEAAKGDIGAAAEAASAKVASVEAEAERLRSESEAAARAAVLTGSVARILAALDSGAAIGEPLADLSAAGIEVPAALVDQAQGVPTLGSLRDSFPETARNALAITVRNASDTSTWGRITAFFRSQSGARSLTPRAGDDPDAILSRAEANLQAGDLAQTLAELGTLPEGGRQVMAEWMARAERRQQAVAAAEALQQAVK